MSDTNPTDPPIGHPNRNTIIGLRELATFLLEHPELPETFSTELCLRVAGSHQSPARETLTALATALGDAAEEVENGPYVYIQGHFTDGVRIEATASRAELAGAVMPEYEAILRPALDPVR